MIEMERTTEETSLYLSLDVRPQEKEVSIETDCGFMDHMLELMAFHGDMSLKISGKGDRADDHHLVEDIGIVLGQALLKSLEDIKYDRYGWALLPMDGSLAMIALDLSGRGSLNFDMSFPTEKCGSFDLELVEEFWRAFSREGKFTVHIKSMAVDNSHHLAEALFKGAGRAFKQALSPSEELKSTKGILI